MHSRSYTEIRSLSPSFVRAVAEEYGVPDNFVESAERSFAGIPNVDSDPGAHRILENLETSLNQYAGKTIIENGVSVG